MTNSLANLVFCIKNANTTFSSDPSRGAVTAGQATNAFKAATELKNTIGKEARAAVDALKIASKNDKILEYAGKGLKFASENVNPLICIAAGAKVITSDDKVSTAIEQTSALSAMFAVEKFMKTELNSKKSEKFFAKMSENISKLAKKFKLNNFMTKTLGHAPAVVKGTTFVAGSIIAYSAGEKFGKLLTKKDRAEQSQ